MYCDQRRPGHVLCVVYYTYKGTDYGSQAAASSLISARFSVQKRSITF